MYEGLNAEFIDDGIDCGLGEKICLLVDAELDTVYYVLQFNWSDEIRKEFYDQIEAAFIQQGGYMRKCDRCGRPYPCFPMGINSYSCQNPECLEWDRAETRKVQEEHIKELFDRLAEPEPEPIPEYIPKAKTKQSAIIPENKRREKVLYDRPSFIQPKKKLRPNYIQDRQRNPTDKQREFIIKRDGGICQYCGDPGDVIDHVLPFAHGGRTVLSNLVCSCQRCNSVFKDKVFGSFIEKRSWMLDYLGIS